MFNLEQAIGQWRAEIKQQGLNGENLAELESHLCETINEARKDGSPDQLAFQKAVEQIGSSSSIKVEFDKTPATKQVEKIIGAIGIAAYACATIYGLFFSPFITPSSWERFLGLLALAVTVCVVVGSTYAWRIFPVIAEKGLRLFVGIAFVTLGALVTAGLFIFVLPAIELTLSQLTIMALWALLPMLIGTSIFVGLTDAAARRAAV